MYSDQPTMLRSGTYDVIVVGARAAGAATAMLLARAGLRTLLDREAEREEDVYVKAFAEGLAVEKREIARELERHGIGSLLTKPESLTVDAINRYLQLKARGAF